MAVLALLAHVARLARMAVTELPQYCQGNRALLANPAEMAVQVSTAALDLLAKTAEMERMVYQGVAGPLATLAPLVLPVKTARTAFAGQLVFQAKVVSTERTAAMV